MNGLLRLGAVLAASPTPLSSPQPGRPSPAAPAMPSSYSGIHTLGDWANLATILGFAITITAIVFAGRQLRLQAQSQKLTAVLETNRLWWDVPPVRSTTVDPIALSSVTIDLIAKIYAEAIAEADSALQPWVTPRREIVQGAPFVLTALLPAGATEAAPNNEPDYRAALLGRAMSVGLVMTALRQVAKGSDPARLYPRRRVPRAICARVSDDLAAVGVAIDRYVGSMNEVAELYEVGLIDRRLFVGKRHVALIQQAFAIEPYLLWRNTVYSGRWGLRILSMGMAARSFHWKSTLHTSVLRLRVDPPGYARGAGPALSLAERIGTIIGRGGESDRLLPLGRFHRWDDGRGFTPDDKRRQNNLLTQLLRNDGSGETGEDQWLALLVDQEAQSLKRQELRKKQNG